MFSSSVIISSALLVGGFALILKIPEEDENSSKNVAGPLTSATVQDDHSIMTSNTDQQQERKEDEEKAKVNCHMEEYSEFKELCETFNELICISKTKQKCSKKEYNDCPDYSVSENHESFCFNVTDLICSLEEIITYDTVVDDYLVQVCTKLKRRICDTVYNMEADTKDNFMCTNITSMECQFVDITLTDSVCKFTVEFDCKLEEVSNEDGDKKRTVCTRSPVEKCYNTPRQIRKEVCKPRVTEYCSKLTNSIVFPLEYQNCHFEDWKVCGIETRTRTKKAPNRRYQTHCTPIPREICKQEAIKTLVTKCSMKERIKCGYISDGAHCEEVERKHCYMVENIVEKEICE